MKTFLSFLLLSFALVVTFNVGVSMNTDGDAAVVDESPTVPVLLTTLYNSSNYYDAEKIFKLTKPVKIGDSTTVRDVRQLDFSTWDALTITSWFIEIG